jgi:trimeric autotransporter adhesin
MKIKLSHLVFTGVSLAGIFTCEAGTTVLNKNGTFSVTNASTTAPRILEIYGATAATQGSLGTNYIFASGECDFNDVRVGKGSGNLPHNTAIGFGALDGYSATGDFVTGVGSYALQKNSSGVLNTAFGHAALQLNTAGNHNTASGVGVLRNNTTGHNNTAMGVNSSTSNTTGGSNLSVGMNSSYYNVIGSENTAVGVSSLFKNVASQNTGVGTAAFQNNTTGSANTAIGHHAGTWLRDGATPLSTSSASIYIGASCRGMSNADYNSIVIGAGAWGEGANTTVIGNGATTSTHLYGQTISDSLKVNGSTVLNGATVLAGKVTLSQAQGDIPMLVAIP